MLVGREEARGSRIRSWNIFQNLLLVKFVLEESWVCWSNESEVDTGVASFIPEDKELYYACYSLEPSRSMHGNPCFLKAFEILEILELKDFFENWIGNSKTCDTLF